MSTKGPSDEPKTGVERIEVPFQNKTFKPIIINLLKEVVTDLTCIEQHDGHDIEITFVGDDAVLMRSGRTTLPHCTTTGALLIDHDAEKILGFALGEGSETGFVSKEIAAQAVTSCIKHVLRWRNQSPTTALMEGIMKTAEAATQKMLDIRLVQSAMRKQLDSGTLGSQTSLGGSTLILGMSRGEDIYCSRLGDGGYMLVNKHSITAMKLVGGEANPDGQSRIRLRRAVSLTADRFAHNTILPLPGEMLLVANSGLLKGDQQHGEVIGLRMSDLIDKGKSPYDIALQLIKDSQYRADNVMLIIRI